MVSFLSNEVNATNRRLARGAGDVFVDSSARSRRARVGG
jgi:hypothetical protein